MKIEGLPVVDATKKVVIKITASDVARGDKKKHSSCAAARACARLPDCTEARVHLGRTYLKVGRRYVRYTTPRDLRTEIISFDRGGMFQTGKYTLLPMTPSQIEATREAKRQGSNKETARDKNGKIIRKSKRGKHRVIRGVREHGVLGNQRG